ncbi:M23 family metallopeptidase [Ornithinimicrobium avium]|uniref:M23 family metallopeptidase n=1 Tax=Ornithinimicrobium avium TaxID=2283195 RepID=UPI0013B465A5|nr:peptidoglycan DD-metalloendopeptidase family protein [Ornithinimicrobium avium]
MLLSLLLAPGAAVAELSPDRASSARVVVEDRVAHVVEGLGAPVDGSVLSTVLGVRDPAPRSRFGAGGGDRTETSAWGWPLAGHPAVVRRFDPPQERWSAGHRGIDLAGLVGEPVLSVDAGVVAFSGVVAGVGVVSVDHASGLRSTYQPVTDRVARGTRLGRGDRLGALDEGGHCVLRDCLHLGARRGRHHYVDPEPLLRPVTLSLLPVPPEGR